MSRRLLLISIALVFLTALNLQADALPTIVRIRSTGMDLEGSPTYRLEWDSLSNATYRVQQSASLGTGALWKTVDIVTPVGGISHYEIKGRSIPENSIEFYRLLLPQPAIIAVEPAVLTPDVAVNLYIVGQCFGSNDVLRINGEPQTNAVLLSPTLLSLPSFTPVVAGTYVFELVAADVVVSSFNVTCADAFANPELVLQGPPDEPLASPAAVIKTKTKSNQSNDRVLKTKTKSNQSNDRVVKTKTKSNQSNDRFAGAGYRDDDDDDGVPAMTEDLARLLPAPQSHTRVDSWATIVEMTTGSDGDVHIFPGAPDKCGDGMRQGVTLHSGEVSQQVVDLAIPGRGLDFIWARTYHSRIGRTGAATNGWTFSYDVRLQPYGGGFVIHNGTGRADTFTVGTNGVYTCPEFFSEGTLTGGVFRLTFADTGYWEFNPIDPSSPEATLARIVDRNGNIISLNYDTSGRLTQIVDDLSRTNTVAYDTAGRLASITDFSGRTVTYRYYVGLPGEPGGAGDMKSVTSPPVIGTPHNDFPAGKITTYTYSKGYADDRENHLLLSVIDAAGNITHKYLYQHNESDLEFIRCISVQHGTNTPRLVTYLAQTPSPANHFATLRCVVNDSMGNVSECFLDARGRVLRELKFTGRATPGVPVTDTVNRPTGPLRVDDPPWFETQFSWNNDSLCTRVLLPRGDHVARVYESDFDPSTRPRKRADLRIVRQHAAPAPVIDADGDGLPDPVDPDSDGDGLPDPTERTWYRDYDPRFGSERTASRSVMRLIDVARARSGDPWASKVGKNKVGNGILDVQVGEVCDDFSIEGRKVNQTAGEQCDAGMSLSVNGIQAGNGIRDVGEMCDDGNMDSGDGFVISQTNPRGTVTTASYDSHGNRTSVERRNVPAGTYAIIVDGYGMSYSTSGQLTAITNAADANGYRRVDTFSYYTNGPQAGYLYGWVIDASTPDTEIVSGPCEYDARGNLTRFVNALGHEWLYTYNALDQLVECQSPQLSGATAAIPPWRITTQFTYDSRNNLTHIRHEDRDQNGALATNPWWTTQFIYDDLSRAVGCWRDKDKVVLRCTSVSYDANNNVTLFRSGEAVNGNDPSAVVSFASDERNMPYQVTEAPGTTIAMTSQYDYDANGNVTRVSEGLEGEPTVTSIEYDGFAVQSLPLIGAISVGRKFVVKEGMANVIAAFGEVEYSLMRAQGTTPLAASLRSRLLFVVDTSGSMNRISKITGPMGNVSTFSHDANDNLKIIRHFGQTNDVPGTQGNIRLAESRHEYDGLDRRISTRTAFFDPATQEPIGDGESVTTYAYAPNGQCVSVTDALGRKTTFGYDTVGWFSSVSSDGAKTVTAVFRDQAGNARSITQTDMPDLGGPPQVFSIMNVHDALNRRVSSTDNLGNNENWDFDSRGNVVRHLDANGVLNAVEYDGLNRKLKLFVDSNMDGAILPGELLRTLAWDDNDRLVAEIDSNRNTTTCAYDSRNRLVLQTSPDGTMHTFGWDVRGNPASSTDPNETFVSYTHDLNDRLVSKSIKPGPGVAATTTFEQFAYNGAGDLVIVGNDVSRVEFSYDSLGNKTRIIQDGYQSLATFDKYGNCTSVRYPSGLAVGYAYDALNQVKFVTRCDGCGDPWLGDISASFSYHGPGRLAEIRRPNGVTTVVEWNGLVSPPNAPDDHGWRQVSRVDHHRAGTPIDQRRFTYDQKQNKTARMQTAPFSAAVPPRKNEFSYDALNRLRSYTDSVLKLIRSYDLDAEGNRRTVTDGSVVETYTRDSTLPEPGDFQMDQYTDTPFGQRRYDRNGNQQASIGSDGLRAYSFDYANRLVEVSQLGSDGTPQFIASFTYDALGRRISKTTPGLGAPSTRATRYFVYGGGAGGSQDTVIEVMITAAVGGISIAAQFLIAPDGRPDIIMAFTATGEARYYHHDDLGSVLALTDDSGRVVERCDYGAYGEPQFLNADGLALVDANGLPVTSSPVGNPFLFRGMFWEGDLMLYCDGGSAYMDPKLGRYVLRAGVPLRRGANASTFAGDNPWSSDGPLSAVAQERIKLQSGVNLEIANKKVTH